MTSLLEARFRLVKQDLDEVKTWGNQTEAPEVKCHNTRLEQGPGGIKARKF